MVPATNTQLGKLLASYFATSTLRNEFLGIIEQQKIAFISIFAA